MVFRKLFGGKQEPPRPPPPPPEPTRHPLEQAVAGLAQQDKAQAASSAALKAQLSETQRMNLEDFRKLREGVILPAFQETIALFETHGSRVHVGKNADEEWAGESARLNIYGKAEYKGPFIVFAFPDSRKRDVHVARTLIESKAADISIDDLTADRVKKEIAAFIEEVRHHRAK
jgi:hypothetical protein